MLDRDNLCCLMPDAPEGVKLHVKASPYDDFTSRYTGGHYAQFMVEI